MLHTPMITAVKITAVRRGLRHMLRQDNLKSKAYLFVMLLEVMVYLNGTLCTRTYAFKDDYTCPMASTGFRRWILRAG